MSTTTPERGGPAGMPPERFSLKRRFFSWPTLLAYAIAGGALALTVTHVFKINWGDTWQLIRSTNPLDYLLAFVLYYLSFWFRGIRWILIAKTARMDQEPGVKLPGTLVTSAIILMGWFANAVAFLRLGDMYRAWAFAQESKGSFSASLGTILAERVLDMGAVLLMLLVAAVGLIASSAETVPTAVIVAAIALVVVLALLLVAMRLFGLRLARRLPARLHAPYERFHMGTLSGFQPKALPMLTVLGVAGWLLETARLYFVAHGIGIEIGIWNAMFAALAGAMLSTIPTPGGFGFVEGGLTGVLIIMGLGHNDAFAVTVVDRTISWISIIIIGGALFFFWQAVKMRKSGGGQRTPAAPGASATERSP